MIRFVEVRSTADNIRRVVRFHDTPEGKQRALHELVAMVDRGEVPLLCAASATWFVRECEGSSFLKPRKVVDF